MAINAITTAINFNPTLASVFATAGVAANPDHSSHSFDLDHVNKHNWIEHDVSLSRQDIAFGNNSHFDKERFEKFLASFGDVEATSYAAASNARYQRVRESKERHEKEGKEFTYGIKEVIMSYGETALYLNLLGHDGVAPLNWVKIFFGEYLSVWLAPLMLTYSTAEEERLPYAEGWRKPTHTIDQPLMNKVIFNLISTNEHKGEEALQAGVGTVTALKTVVQSFIKVPSVCTIM
jgi:hypothetical protein